MMKVPEMLPRVKMFLANKEGVDADLPSDRETQISVVTSTNDAALDEWSGRDSQGPQGSDSRLKSEISIDGIRSTVKELCR